ncbi:LacI family DNA-binding transcriptional regulator [Ruegeria hyattellae]|uniref:LacI family DNA-binding transcriptional regulator n=1 Tax=Ruegeria hyattellae TaxID=3233337 RepID=UPI00355BD4EB
MIISIMERAMARVTLKDVAERAGVGVATVDRVLNARAPVSAATSARVLSAADALGYRSSGLLRRRVEEMAPAKRLGFILQKESKWFYRELAAELQRQAEQLRSIRASVVIRYVESLSPSGLAAAIIDMHGKVDTIGLVAIDHPEVNRAIASLDVPVFALLSPLSSPDVTAYVGIDSRKAGRTAGWAMARLNQAEGAVGILIGSHRYLGHEALESGFRSYMREFAPQKPLRDSVVYLDDAAVAYEATAELLQAHKDLSGIYHCGGGVSGALKALREAGRARDVFYICHERTPVTEAALADSSVDMVINNPLDQVADRVTYLMSRCLAGKPFQAQIGTIPFYLCTSENL